MLSELTFATTLYRYNVFCFTFIATFKTLINYAIITNHR